MKASEFVKEIEEYLPYYQENVLPFHKYPQCPLQHTCSYKEALETNLWNGLAPYSEGYGFSDPFVKDNRIILPMGDIFDNGKASEDYSRNVGEILSALKKIIDQEGDKELFMQIDLFEFLPVTGFIVSYGDISVVSWED